MQVLAFKMGCFVTNLHDVIRLKSVNWLKFDGLGSNNLKVPASPYTSRMFCKLESFVEDSCWDISSEPTKSLCMHRSESTEFTTRYPAKLHVWVLWLHNDEDVLLYELQSFSLELIILFPIWTLQSGISKHWLVDFCLAMLLKPCCPPGSFSSNSRTIAVILGVTLCVHHAFHKQRTLRIIWWAVFAEREQAAHKILSWFGALWLRIPLFSILPFCHTLRTNNATELCSFYAFVLSLLGLSSR